MQGRDSNAQASLAVYTIAVGDLLGFDTPAGSFDPATELLPSPGPPVTGLGAAVLSRELPESFLEAPQPTAPMPP